MTNQDILHKAVDLAIANGWNCREFIAWDSAWSLPVNQTGQVMAELLDYDYKQEEYLNSVNDRKAMSLIFNHDFAKALWNGEPYLVHTKYAATVSTDNSWKHHLQQMVITEDPIAYLGENI